MDVRVGEIKTLTAKNVSMCGFVGQIVAISTNGTDVPVIGNIDFTKAQCKAVLTRDGSEQKLFNMNLSELIALCHFGNVRYDQIFSDSAIGIAQPGKAMFPVRFGLGQLNLKNSDTIDLEIELKPGFFASNMSVGVSYMRFEPFKTIGVEYTTPEILSYTLEPNIEQYKLVLGNGISRIMMYAKGSTVVPVDGNQALASVVLDSDKIKINEKFADQVNRRIDQFQTSALANIRGENIMFTGGELLHNVTLDLEFIPAKVTNAKYKIFVVRENTSTQQLVRADATTGEHVFENAVNMGVQLTNAQRAQLANLTDTKQANLQA